MNFTTENRLSMSRPFPGIVSTTVVATSVILFFVREGGERDATEEGLRKGWGGRGASTREERKGGLDSSHSEACTRLHAAVERISVPS